MKTEQTKAMIEHMLSSLDTPCKELSSWESGFISSLTDQFERKGSLSEKQFEILGRIYAEKTA